MKFTKIYLLTQSGISEALTNMLWDYDTTIITDMVEDAKDGAEVYNCLVALYAKKGPGSILRCPVSTRTTEDYFRITLKDGFGNTSYLKILF